MPTKKSNSSIRYPQELKDKILQDADAPGANLIDVVRKYNLPSTATIYGLRSQRNRNGSNKKRQVHVVGQATQVVSVPRELADRYRQLQDELQAVEAEILQTVVRQR